MGACRSAPLGPEPAAATTASALEGCRMPVERKTRPPQRLEGGGFKIVDIMASAPMERLDPFLIWHELPRAFYKPGEMPGAPMHPHRGFCECPYAKEMVGKDGPGELDVMMGSDHAKNRHDMRAGDFEFGQVGKGFEHQALIHPQWTGFLHMFQLWINLPRSHKMDNPHVINVAAARIPVAKVSEDPAVRVKVLLGKDVFGASSPVSPPHVPVQYLDIELDARAEVTYSPPREMQTRLAYVYAGAPTVGGTPCARGEFLLLGSGDQLHVEAGESGAGLLFLAGQRIGEPVVQHGPFVMTSRAEIQQCFKDYQRGQLCGKITRDVLE